MALIKDALEQHVLLGKRKRRQEEDEDEETREAALKVAVCVLRTMNEHERADVLEQSKSLMFGGVYTFIHKMTENINRQT